MFQSYEGGKNSSGYPTSRNAHRTNVKMPMAISASFCGSLKSRMGRLAPDLNTTEGQGRYFDRVL